MEKRKHYEPTFKYDVVQEYLSGSSKNSLCKKYSIPSRIVLTRWIRKFVGEENRNPMSKQEAINESEEIRRLKKELKETKLALYQAQMRADAYNTLIDVAEEMFQIPIRKKAGTKQ